jgi:hypothetical protein
MRPKLRGITGEEWVEILDRIGNYIERNSKPPADPLARGVVAGS